MSREIKKQTASFSGKVKTISVDADGNAIFYNDIYGYDKIQLEGSKK